MFFRSFISKLLLVVYVEIFRGRQKSQMKKKLRIVGLKHYRLLVIYIRNAKYILQMGMIQDKKNHTVPQAYEIKNNKTETKL